MSNKLLNKFTSKNAYFKLFNRTDDLTNTQ